MSHFLVSSFDIDGTLTKDGYDLWYMTTESLVDDFNQFQDYLKEWKKSKVQDPYGASLKMMEAGVKLIGADNTSDLIRQKTYEFLLDFKKKDLFRSLSFNELQKCLWAGHKVVLNTTNYQESAQALRSFLLKHFLEKGFDEKNLMAYGTQIDWEDRSVKHFNMGQGKVEILNKAFQQDKYSLINSYGDDPLGNDSEMLKAAQNAFVISSGRNLSEVGFKYELVKW